MLPKYTLNWQFDICNNKRTERGGLLWEFGQKQMKLWEL